MRSGHSPQAQRRGRTEAVAEADTTPGDSAAPTAGRDDRSRKAARRTTAEARSDEGRGAPAKPTRPARRERATQPRSKGNGEEERGRQGQSPPPEQAEGAPATRHRSL